jgi:RNA recognition motif-containing protein
VYNQFGCFVSNMPFTATEDDLKEHFAQFGDVTSVKIIYDRDTGRSKGCAFVNFASAAERDAVVLNADGSNLGGRNIGVREAVDKRPQQPKQDYKRRQSNDY